MTPDSASSGEGAVRGRSPEVTPASEIILSSADSSSAGIGGDSRVEGPDPGRGASGAAGGSSVPDLEVGGVVP